MFRRRDDQLEMRLQNALDSGCSVWVVGDIHGHLDAFENLLEQLELAPGDHVLCLGDLIDRGQDSAGVVRRVRQSQNIHTIMGNHEWFALESVEADGSIIADSGWMWNGGLETLMSYGLEDTDRLPWISDEFQQESGLGDDIAWMSQLPIEVVLDDWRMVHAGYDPKCSEEDQLIDDAITGMLWVRRLFHNHESPWDQQRCILVGHTVTCTLPGASHGDIAVSAATLDDGRPAWLGLDTSMFNGRLNRLSALNLQDSRLLHASPDQTWHGHLDSTTA